MENVRVGTLIAPESYVLEAGAFTKEALDVLDKNSVRYLDVVAGAPYLTLEQSYVFAGSVANIRPENRNLAFAAIGYIEVIKNGESTVRYSPVYTVRSVSRVATAAYADVRAEADGEYLYEVNGVFSPYSEEQRSVLEALRDPLVYEISTVEAGLECAKKAGCSTILTPAPARLLGENILKNVDYLIPNEIEILQVLRGYTSINSAAEGLLERGVKNVIVTLGSSGSMLFNKDGQKKYPAHPLRPIDTVGAGDCFAGSLMAGLKIYGDDLDAAIKLASAAASLSITRMGAQSHAKLDEVLKLMGKSGL